MNALILLAFTTTAIVVGAKPAEDITIYASKEAAKKCQTERCILLTQDAVQAVYKAGKEAGENEFRSRLTPNMCLRGAS